MTRRDSPPNPALWIGASSSITVARARSDAAQRQAQLAARAYADHIRELAITGNEALTIVTAALPPNH